MSKPTTTTEPRQLPPEIVSMLSAAGLPIPKKRISSAHLRSLFRAKHMPGCREFIERELRQVGYIYEKEKSQ